jgi:hypothetical protein
LQITPGVIFLPGAALAIFLSALTGVVYERLVVSAMMCYIS